MDDPARDHHPFPSSCAVTAEVHGPRLNSPWTAPFRFEDDPIHLLVPLPTSRYCALDRPRRSSSPPTWTMTSGGTEVYVAAPKGSSVDARETAMKDAGYNTANLFRVHEAQVTVSGTGINGPGPGAHQRGGHADDRQRLPQGGTLGGFDTRRTESALTAPKRSSGLGVDAGSSDECVHRLRGPDQR